MKEQKEKVTALFFLRFYRGSLPERCGKLGLRTLRIECRALAGLDVIRPAKIRATVVGRSAQSRSETNVRLCNTSNIDRGARDHAIRDRLQVLAHVRSAQGVQLETWRVRADNDRTELTAPLGTVRSK